MIGHLGELIGHYGYLIVAAFIFFEGIAIPFPTDTTLVTAAAFAAHGRLSVLVIFLLSTLCATLGTTVAFILGRRGGDFFERHSRKVNPAVLARTRTFFDRHGGTAVMAGRFIPVARMLISPMAGLSTMSLARFTVFNLIGAAIWSGVFCGVGYFFGQHPPAFGHGLARAALIVAVGLAVVATVVIAGGWLVEESDAAWRAEGTIWHRVLMSAPLRLLAAHSPRARAFLFRRFTPGDYLGLNLTIGLGLSFVALIIFSAIMNALLSRDAVPQFDIQLASALRETATPAADHFWGVVSSMATLPVMVVPGLLIGLLLALRRNRLPIIGFVASIVGALLLDAVVKHFFAHQHGATSAGGIAELGTPSGQALGAFVGYGMIGYFLVLLVPNRRLAGLIVVATFGLVLAICFGRLYLGTRYFSDIVSGLAAGGVWLSTCVTGLEVARRRAERERHVERAASDDRR
ncbi:MAG: phosphoesterase PA-phosphatase related protein [Gemmatimonadetes bacterium]|jgi:membrane protein DedA with SNARE-associated domain/membrane-associated phospholipid phosphatase|nr:phosphoesterase PA-phosphatase related protein [Gemmatimonadota bacterium]